jgi:heat shock protein HslJ
MSMVHIFSILFAGIIVFLSTAGGTAAGGDDRSLDPRQVLNTTWQWESTVTPVEKITSPAPEQYTILLTDDGKVQAKFDCNRGGGDYRISTGKLSFGSLYSTRMACPEDSLDGPFMRDLQRVFSFFIENGYLYLELLYDSGTMKFKAAP